MTTKMEMIHENLCYIIRKCDQDRFWVLTIRISPTGFSSYGSQQLSVSTLAIGSLSRAWLTCDKPRALISERSESCDKDQRVPLFHIVINKQEPELRHWDYVPNRMVYKQEMSHI